MKYKVILAITAVLAITAILAVFGQTRSDKQSGKMVAAANTPISKSKNAVSKEDVFDGQKIVKTEEEWRKQLTPEEFYILREEGTERAYTGEYTDNEEHGDYYCAACHLKVFSTDAQFHSGTGWVSFYQPIAAPNVTEKTDEAFGMTRTEIECSRCGSHLGHVFDDGPEPTGLRYCMNSVALDFEKRK